LIAPEGLARLGSVGGHVDQPGDVARVATRLTDDRAGVGVGDQDDRAAQCLDESSQVRGVGADAAQQVRRRHHVQARRLEPGDDPGPARRVDERAVNQHDSGSRVRRAHEDLLR